MAGTPQPSPSGQLHLPHGVALSQRRLALLLLLSAIISSSLIAARQHQAVGSTVTLPTPVTISYDDNFFQLTSGHTQLQVRPGLDAPPPHEDDFLRLTSGHSQPQAGVVDTRPLSEEASPRRERVTE